MFDLAFANNLVSFDLPGGDVITDGASPSGPDFIAQSAGPEPIPEPGTWAAATLLAGGAAFMRWRKRAKAS